MVKLDNKIPLLRFSEFKGEWDICSLKQISKDVSYGMNSAATIYDGSNKYLRITDIDEELRIFKPNPLSSPKGNLEEKYKLKKNDIVFTRTGASVGKSYIYKESDGNLYYAGFLIKFSITKANSYFVFSATLRPHYKKWILVMSMRSGQPGINAEEFKSLKFLIPSLPEQQKIASFLTAVDDKIQQLTKKKSLLEQYKKGVMQKIFKQRIRFKDENGKKFPEWRMRKLNEVLYEHKTKSTGNEEVFSVSVHKGLINQIEHLGRSFAAKTTSHYNLVKPHDIVYTKSPTGDFPLGIIKQSKIDKDVIVSPLYGVFTPETAALGYILDVYFESKVNVSNYLSSIIQKGAKNTINITNSTFLSKKILLPASHDEQRKIADFLISISDKIEHVNTQLEKTKTFKKGLLQQMFV